MGCRFPEEASGLESGTNRGVYRKGDFIGRDYEVFGVLGRGGFGVVYLVYSRQSGAVYAFKTFRDEYLADEAIRDRFRREAQIWVNLERHPYLVRAHFVDDVAGRLFIAMEYIAPGDEGLNSLEGYLRRRPPGLAQSLRWAIQFCYGMEYAFSKGVRAHRDVKPANILISQDGTVKIADFGLAGVLGAPGGGSGEAPGARAGRSGSGEAPDRRPDIAITAQDGRVGLSVQTLRGTGFGTPTHMPPEQFTEAATCDMRSDIYSFGVVLYQMAAGRLPFLAAAPRNASPGEGARFWWEMHRLHREAPVPRVETPLWPCIRRCLEKEPSARYRSFGELRLELERLLERESGEVVRPPEPGELEAWEWTQKGGSLHHLGLDEEALRCYDKALGLDPGNALIWSNRAGSLYALDRMEEAVQCCDRALAISPGLAPALSNKGTVLQALGRYEEAVRCYDQALEARPRDPVAWTNRGNALRSLARYEEAVRSYDRALEVDPRLALAWSGKAGSLHELGRYEEAVASYDQVLALEPHQSGAWNNRGRSLYCLQRLREALESYDRALALDQREGASWNGKGRCLHDLGRFAEALGCFDRAVEYGPLDAAGWLSRANCLRELGRLDEAVASCDRGLELDPRSEALWVLKGLAEFKLGRLREAAASLRQYLDVVPPEKADRVEAMKKVLAQMEKLGGR